MYIGSLVEITNPQDDIKGAIGIIVPKRAYSLFIDKDDWVVVRVFGKLKYYNIAQLKFLE